MAIVQFRTRRSFLFEIFKSPKAPPKMDAKKKSINGGAGLVRQFIGSRYKNSPPTPREPESMYPTGFAGRDKRANPSGRSKSYLLEVSYIFFRRGVTVKKGA